MNISFLKIKRKLLGQFSYKTFFLVIIFLLFILLAKAETNTILAEIGQHKITLKDLQNKILRIRENMEEGYSNHDKKALLLEMVRLEVFAKEAMVLGLEKDKEVKLRIKRLQNDILATEENHHNDKENKSRLRVVKNYVIATEYLKKEVNDKININEKEILQYFNENRFKFMEPEMIRARQIYIKVNRKTKIDEARKKAERILERLKNGEDFSALAGEFSKDFLSKDIGGDLGYFAKGRLVPELEEPVFHLKKGEISPVLKSESGFHIFKLEDRIESRPLEYHEAREQIVKTLKAEKQNKLYKAVEEKLFKKYKVKIYKDRIPSTTLD